MDVQLHLVVDWIRCRGHGICAELAPEAIVLDDWGFPMVKAAVPRDGERDAQRACDACPSSALTLVEVDVPVSPKR
ncbi:MAG: ferredoxin [Actinomycetes bacterium]